MVYLLYNEVVCPQILYVFIYRELKIFMKSGRFLKRLIAFILTVTAVVSVMPFGAVISFADTSYLKPLDINTALKRIKELSEKLDGKYFTVNETYCLPPESSESGHGCDNCNNKYVIYADWFKNRVGKVPDDISFLPRYNVPDGSHVSPPAKSCAGFAMFAGWYVAADSSSENLGHQSRHPGLASVDFTIENLEKYAKPGDVIFGQRYHAIVFIGIEDGLLNYIDCNATRYTDGNCCIHQALRNPDDMKGYMGSCVSITGFYSPTGTLDYKPDFVCSTYGNKTTLIKYNGEQVEVKIPDRPGVKKITEIGKRAFYNNTEIISVEIPFGVKTIGDSAFYKCENLRKIVIPESVNSISSGAFLKCPGLVIYGYKSTYAESFAKEKHIRFVSLGSVPCRHPSSKWVITVKPTCISSGEKKLVCDSCGKTLSVSAVDRLESGWIKNSDGKWNFYRFGVLQTGWQKDKDNWYYLGADGNMQTGWLELGGKKYYLASSGKMLTGWRKISSKWYYFNTSGSMKTGWLKENGIWYYLDESGAMVTGAKTINGKTYYFASNGSCKNP